MKRQFWIFLIALTTACSTFLAHATEYPDRTITIEVPYSPGASVDIMARMIAEGLQKKFGESVVVENHVGASGQIGLNRVARAKPDGYTLGVGQVTNLALAPSVSKQVLYNPKTDFVAVAQIAENYLAIVSKPDGPYRNINDVIALAKKEKQGLKLGSPSHVSGGQFPYKSGGIKWRRHLAASVEVGINQTGAEQAPVTFS